MRLPKTSSYVLCRDVLSTTTTTTTKSERKSRNLFCIRFVRFLGKSKRRLNDKHKCSKRNIMETVQTSLNIITLYPLQQDEWQWVSEWAAENQVKVQLCDVLMMLLLLFSSSLYIFYLFCAERKLFRTSTSDFSWGKKIWKTHNTQFSKWERVKEKRKMWWCWWYLMWVWPKKYMFSLCSISRAQQQIFMWKILSLLACRRRRRCRAHIHNTLYCSGKNVESINTCRKLENTMFL